MGYTTDFEGSFKVNKPLDSETKKLVDGICSTRRMKRDLTKLDIKDDEKYGVEGEFYIDGTGDFGQDDDASVLNHNCPPKTQPGLWCSWCYDEENQCIEWSGMEKFYNYIAWIKYLIETIFEPRGYKLNGNVKWIGEDYDKDTGYIVIKDNIITILDIDKKVSNEKERYCDYQKYDYMFKN